MDRRSWIASFALLAVTAGGVALWLRLGSASAGMRRVAPQRVVRTAPPAAPPRHPIQKKPEAPALPERAQDTPDLTQTDRALALPGGGNSYCGPVAISNSLMWLAAHGYPRLAPEGKTERERQIALVQLISSPRFMATGPQSGTGAMGVMRGLAKYVRHAGYTIASLGYEGWRQHPYEFTRHEPHPQLDWIARGTGAGRAAWINVGWYKRSRYNDAWRRNGGHWLAVVAASQPDVLVLHDSAPYEDGGPLNVFARAQAIDSGWMLDGASAFPAKGYYELGGGMYVKREGETAIIDGAIVLELEPPEAPP